MSDQGRLEKPFVFRPSVETLRYFKNASPEAKLNWLEEANRFVHDFVSQQKLERWKELTRQ